MSVSIITFLLLDYFIELVFWKKIDDLREDKLAFIHNLAVLKPQNYLLKSKNQRTNVNNLYINYLNEFDAKLTHH